LGIGSKKRKPFSQFSIYDLKKQKGLTLVLSHERELRVRILIPRSLRLISESFFHE
jgi:hypothetical protein